MTEDKIVLIALVVSCIIRFIKAIRQINSEGDSITDILPESVKKSIKQEYGINLGRKEVRDITEDFSKANIDAYFASHAKPVEVLKENALSPVGRESKYNYS